MIKKKEKKLYSCFSYFLNWHVTDLRLTLLWEPTFKKKRWWLITSSGSHLQLEESRKTIPRLNCWPWRRVYNCPSELQCVCVCTGGCTTFTLITLLFSSCSFKFLCRDIFIVSFCFVCHIIRNNWSVSAEPFYYIHIHTYILLLLNILYYETIIYYYKVIFTI